MVSNYIPPKKSNFAFKKRCLLFLYIFWKHFMCSLSTFITFSKIMKKLFMCFLLTFLEIQICLLGITFRLTFCNSSKRLIKWFNNFSSFLVKNCYISFFPLHLHRIYFCFLYYHNFFFQFFYPWKDFYNIPTNNFLL